MLVQAISILLVPQRTPRESERKGGAADRDELGPAWVRGEVVDGARVRAHGRLVNLCAHVQHKQATCVRTRVREREQGREGGEGEWEDGAGASQRRWWRCRSGREG